MTTRDTLFSDTPALMATSDMVARVVLSLFTTIDKLALNIHGCHPDPVLTALSSPNQPMFCIGVSDGSKGKVRSAQAYLPAQPAFEVRRGKTTGREDRIRTCDPHTPSVMSAKADKY